MNDMDPISQGVASNAIWAGIVQVWRIAFGPRIEITYPRPQEVLAEPRPLGKSFTYPVRGTLRRLPKGHEIWVLAQSERTGQVWPQGFSSVQYNRDSGTWTGRIHASQGDTIRIIAVVAPPSSQDFFRYFQKVGDKTSLYEPLLRIPPECINSDSVQARIPKV